MKNVTPPPMIPIDGSMTATEAAAAYQRMLDPSYASTTINGDVGSLTDQTRPIIDVTPEPPEPNDSGSPGPDQTNGDGS
jgi:hypothetical protein